MLKSRLNVTIILLVLLVVTMIADFVYLDVVHHHKSRVVAVRHEAEGGVDGEAGDLRRGLPVDP